MDYRFADDLITIRGILNLSQDELASQLNVIQATISRSESGKTEPSAKLLEQVYGYAFRNHVQLNKYFGQGFYTGESYEQAASFISGFDNSSIYFLDFDDSDLKCRRYEVDQDWMMTVAYYRGAIRQYEEHPTIRKLVKRSRECDYIVAPIADNRMFQIIDAFMFGEITDEQCKHCLAATNLGYQYIFINDKAVSRVKILEHCFVSQEEKEYYNKKKDEDMRFGDNKVRMARIKYRGQGRYIDEILK